MLQSFRVYSSTQIKNCIDEWIHDERNRAIVKRKLIDNISYEKAAEEFDLSTTQVKTIVKQAHIILMKHLQ